MRKDKKNENVNNNTQNFNCNPTINVNPRILVLNGNQSNGSSDLISTLLEAANSDPNECVEVNTAQELQNALDNNDISEICIPRGVSLDASSVGGFRLNRSNPVKITTSRNNSYYLMGKKQEQI